MIDTKTFPNLKVDLKTIEKIQVWPSSVRRFAARSAIASPSPPPPSLHNPFACTAQVSKSKIESTRDFNYIRRRVIRIRLICSARNFDRFPRGGDAGVGGRLEGGSRDTPACLSSALLSLSMEEFKSAHSYASEKKDSGESNAAARL